MEQSGEDEDADAEEWTANKVPPEGTSVLTFNKDKQTIVTILIWQWFYLLDTAYSAIIGQEIC